MSTEQGLTLLDQLHLTPVDHLVQMRPQFHHVDAMVEAEARNAPRTAPTRPQEARAVHLTAKSAIDGEEETEETMAKRIATIQAEQWKTFHVIDENDQQASLMSNNDLDFALRRNEKLIVYVEYN